MLGASPASHHDDEQRGSRSSSPTSSSSGSIDSEDDQIAAYMESLTQARNQPPQRALDSRATAVVPSVPVHPPPDPQAEARATLAMQRNSNKAAIMARVPADSLLVIFEYLTVKELLLHVQATSRAFRTLLLSKSYWQSRWESLLASWPQHISPVGDQRPTRGISVCLSDVTQAPPAARCVFLPLLQPIDCSAEGRGFVSAVLASSTISDDARNALGYLRIPTWTRPRVSYRYELKDFREDTGDVQAVCDDARYFQFVAEYRRSLEDAMYVPDTAVASSHLSVMSPELAHTPAPSHDAGLLFPTYHMGPSKPAFHISGSLHCRVEGLGDVYPLYTQRDMELYHWLLCHTYLTDITHHLWGLEEKLAIIGRVVSPTAQTIETRFFMSYLEGSHPRLYTKLIYCSSDFRRDVMKDKFKDCPGMPTAIFTTGFGRVEVDVRPIVPRESIERVATQLGLPATFPWQLLWNVLLHASGSYFRLSSHTGALQLYYNDTLTRAFERAMNLPPTAPLQANPTTDGS